MPTWNEIDTLIREEESAGRDVQAFCDSLRVDYLASLHKHTRRPVIAYYSGFLQKTPHPELFITDFDMNGFMAVSHKLVREHGLDLILHTPGGGIEATRSIVEYLYLMYGKDIRVIVPQLAMSCGTMIACAASCIVLAKHSSLGPTDPQVQGYPAMGVIEEIKTALEEIEANPRKILIWQEVFRRYPPAFISGCERSITGTRNMVKEWLGGNMLSSLERPDESAEAVLRHLMNYKDTTEHGQHFSRKKCVEIGLRVVDLEEDQELQERVLSVHHAYVASFARSKSIKFIENSSGSSWNVSG